MKNLNSNKKGETKLKRCMTSFVTEDFLIDLGSTLENYPEINSNSSVNDDVSELTSIFIKTLDKHDPLKPLSKREIKLNAKPWTTKGILISIKTRNRLFKSCYQCQDPVKIEYYKEYRNKLTHIKAPSVGKVDTSNLKAVIRPAVVFATRFSPETTANDITKFIRQQFPGLTDIKCTKLKLIAGGSFFI